MPNVVKLFPIDPYRHPTCSQGGDVRRVLWRVLTLNLLVSGAKIVVGLFTGSISMLADGFHSAMDASSNVIGLIGSSIASRPPDHNHPYGHQKLRVCFKVVRPKSLA